MRFLKGVALAAVMVFTSGASAPSQTVATFGVMREKLTHNARALEAIMTANYDLLQKSSMELANATRRPGWAVLKTDPYMRYSLDFQRAAERLVEAAKDRDLDAAALGYTTLTTSCSQCHRYIRRARIAK